jgi:hypothetical protein
LLGEKDIDARLAQCMAFGRNDTDIHVAVSEFGCGDQVDGSRADDDVG